MEQRKRHEIDIILLSTSSTKRCEHLLIFLRFLLIGSVSAQNSEGKIFSFDSHVKKSSFRTSNSETWLPGLNVWLTVSGNLVGDFRGCGFRNGESTCRPPGISIWNRPASTPTDGTMPGVTYDLRSQGQAINNGGAIQLLKCEIMKDLLYDWNIYDKW